MWFYASILLLVILLLVWYYQTLFYLEGFWESSKEFNKTAGLENMYFYFGNRTGWLNQEFSGYCLAKPVSNQCFTATISSLTNNGEIIFDNSQIFPSTVKFTLEPLAGTLILHDNDMVYAVLYKNHEFSEILNSI